MKEKEEHTHISCSHAHGKALTSALWIAALFMIAEVIGGWIANSLALISDAMHMFTDVGAMLLGLVVVRIIRRPRTPIMSFGYHRAEILGALASSLSLWVLSGVLIYEAIKRLIAPQEVEGPVVFIIASIGLCANLLMMKSLHGHHHQSLNIRAAYLHVIGDLLGSIGVILSGLILWVTHWNPIDPIITLIFTLGILYSSGKIIKQTLVVLMESAPKHLDPLQIEKDLSQIKGVKEIHNLHIWSLSSNRVALSVHLVAESPHDALNEAHRIIEKKYKIHHMTVQVEDPALFEPRFCFDTKN